MGCNDPTALGTELLEQDLIEVGSTDTLTVLSKSVLPMRTLSYAAPYQTSIFLPAETNNQLSTYLFGNFEDPIFGNTVASIFIQPEKQTIQASDGSLAFNPDFSESTIDSIFLILPFDTLGFYGDISQEFGIEVFRLTETPARENHFNDTDFAFDPSPLADTTFLPSFSEVGVNIPINGVDSTLTFPAQLRIALPIELGQELIDLDTMFYRDDDSFFDYFKGFYLRPTKATNGVIGFPFRLREAGGGLDIYYTQKDTTPNSELLIPKIYKFGFFSEAVRMVNCSYDYENGMVNPFLESEEDSDSLIFVQGMAGLMGKVEFPTLSSLGNVVINKAVLELSLATLPNDDTTLYKPIEQLSFFQVLNDGTIEPLEDLSIVMLSGRSVADVFGGRLDTTDDGTPYKYSLNITAALQDMLNNNIRNEILISGWSSDIRASLAIRNVAFFGNDFTLSAFSSIERANRSVLYGANHPDYPIRLSITFSRP